MSDILKDLDKLIKKAAASKQAATNSDEAQVKQAADGSTSAKLDSAEDGTSPATTGGQAAANAAANRENYADPSADKDAETNPSGEAVEMSSDEATAASPDGEEGAEGSELEAAGGISEADNGPEDTDSPNNDGKFNTGAFEGVKKRAELIEELRKQAATLRKQASDSLTPLERFLVKSARNTSDPRVKTAAEAMDDVALAEAATGSLTDQLGTGDIGDEEAAQILEEAVASGAVTQEELAEAAAAIGGGGAMEEAPPVDGALGGAPEGMLPEALPPEGMPPELAGAPDGEAPPIDMLEQKIAAANIGPDHPQYLQKLAQFYPGEMNAGYAFALKLAEELMAEEDYEEKEEGEEEGGNGGDSESKETEESSGNCPEGDGAEVEKVVKELEAAPLPPAADAGPLGAMGPTSPEEEQALAAVQQELGMDDAALAQLMAAEAPGAVPVEKMAAALDGCDPKTRYRTVILNKVAALKA